MDSLKAPVCFLFRPIFLTFTSYYWNGLPYLTLLFIILCLRGTSE